MIQRLRRLLPSRDTLHRSRWLSWIGPALNHPRLWHMSRRGIAMGMALGVFFGLLIPIAQIPLAAGAAVILRANVPTAVASTLVTNPVTFGPVYYAAWRTGRFILGVPTSGHEQPPLPPLELVAEKAQGTWFSRVWLRLSGVGKPLVLGLAIFATVTGLLTYLLVSLGWYAKVMWQRRRRRGQRIQQP
ncbi:MAG: DUF2062 domain-containing protein [Rhizobacter sp.]|nr:DUF2062 domain-containing protein [Rhizobacter sp.]